KILICRMYGFRNNVQYEVRLQRNHQFTHECVEDLPTISKCNLSQYGVVLDLICGHVAIVASNEIEKETPVMHEVTPNITIRYNAIYILIINLISSPMKRRWSA
ncbi:unnamed protein product, partial [Owenia fusiformis]